MKTLLTARLYATVSIVQMRLYVPVCSKIFARKHTATHKPTSDQPLLVTTMTRTQKLAYDLLQLSIYVPEHSFDEAKVNVVLSQTQKWKAEQFDFDGDALNWFDLPKLSYQCVKPNLAKLQTVFSCHGGLWSLRGRGRCVCRFDWNRRSGSKHVDYLRQVKAYAKSKAGS